MLRPSSRTEEDFEKWSRGTSSSRASTSAAFAGTWTAQPIHAGTGLEILLALNPKYTERGEVIDFEAVWMPVRLEFEFGPKDGRALAYWPVHAANMFSEVSEGAQFRWLLI